MEKEYEITFLTNYLRIYRLDDDIWKMFSFNCINEPYMEAVDMLHDVVIGEFGTYSQSVLRRKALDKVKLSGILVAGEYLICCRWGDSFIYAKG